MTQFSIIKVANDHNGSLPPGLIILVPSSDVQRTGGSISVSFANPVGLGGYSFGTLLGTIDAAAP